MVIYKELNWETLMKTLKDSVKDITAVSYTHLPIGRALGLR